MHTPIFDILNETPESLAIVRAVIGLGKSFNTVETAEGIETKAPPPTPQPRRQPVGR